MTTTQVLDVRRAESRFTTEAGWLDSRHSFSFGRHYDPHNTHHGLLIVHNDDVVAPGTGFSTHPHRDMEIVTWVLDGELVHQDSAGHNGIIVPGLAQRMSAGTGIFHSEMNATPGGPVHFVQMWILPDRDKERPGYEQLDINAELDRGGLVPVASGRGHEAAISIRQHDAVLYAARLGTAESVTLPAAPYVHLYVARGPVELEGAGRLDTGDAVRLIATDDLRVTASADRAELLVWEMHAAAPGW